VVRIAWTSNDTKFCRYGDATFTCGTASVTFEFSQVGTLGGVCNPV